MYRLQLKQLIRQPKRFIALILAVSLSGVILCFGATLLLSAKQSTVQAKKSFTTIAVPNFTALIKASGLYDATRSYPNNSEDWRKCNAAMRSFIDLYHQLEATASIYSDSNSNLPEAYLGYSPNLIPLTSRIVNPHERNPHLLDTPYNYAVFVVTCSESDTKFVWKVDQVISLHPGYKQPTYLQSASQTIKYLWNDTITDIFEVGKQYIILGTLQDNVIRSKPKEINGVINPKETEYIEDNTLIPYFTLFEARPVIGEQGGLMMNEDGEIPIESMPYTEITQEMNEFLSSNQGIAWKSIINNVNITLHSAYVVPTNNLQSIISFNQSQSSIIDGREITSEEYKNGSKVCVINKAFADYNHLRIGDRIPLSLHAVYQYIDGLNLTASIPTWYHNVYPYELELLDSVDYQIVGIYQSPEWSYNPYSVSPNTIFVPHSSIGTPPKLTKRVQLLNDSGMLTYGMSISNPNFLVISIPNDKMEVVKEELANETYHDYEDIDPINGQLIFENKLHQEDIAEYFVFYDQGYSAVSSTLKSMNTYSIIIFILCILVWCAMIFFFIYLFIYRKRAEIGILLSLGLSRKRAFHQLFMNCVIIAVIAFLITGSVVIVSANQVVHQIYSSLQETHLIDEAYSNVTIGSANQGMNSNNGTVDTTVKAAQIFEPVISYPMITLILILQTILFLVVIRITYHIVLNQKPLHLLQSKETK